LLKENLNAVVYCSQPKFTEIMQLIVVISDKSVNIRKS